MSYVGTEREEEGEEPCLEFSYVWVGIGRIGVYGGSDPSITCNVAQRRITIRRYRVREGEEKNVRTGGRWW